MRQLASIGQLDQKIGLRSQSLTSDGAGGATVVWTEYASVWAQVEPMSGREREAAQRTEAAAMYVVTIRHRTDVKEGHVVRWGTRDLNVRFVRQASGRALYLALECEIGAAV